MRLKILLMWLLSFLCLALCTGCKTQTIVQEVPIEVVKTKIEYRDRFLKDSVYVQDSITTIIKDSVIYKDRFRLIYKDRLLRDTIIITDSVDKPVYITKTIEKTTNKLNKFQIFLCGSGILLWLTILLYVIIKIKFK